MSDFSNEEKKPQYLIRILRGTTPKMLEEAGFKGLRRMCPIDLPKGNIYWCDELGDEENSDKLGYHVLI